MKKLLLTVMLIVSVVSASYGADKPKITIYTSMYEDVIEAMTETLHQKFPNYDVEFFYGGTGTLQAKIAAEIDTKKLGCDMLMVADPSYSLELKELGLLHPYISKEAGNLAFDYDPEGYWYSVRNLNMVLAYTPEKLKDKYGYEYFDKLGANRVMIESGSVALTKLETGECKVIMILEESVLKKREEEDSELEVIYPSDGVICVPSPIMTVKDEWSAHKNSKICEELTDWFLSPEGQSYIVKGWMHSVLKNPPAIPYDSIQTSEIVKSSMPVDWARCLRERTELRTNFEERVKSAK